jgi:flagellar basal-body rod protein FlgB
MSSLDGIQTVLETAMRGAWQRQTLLTQNIANAETPGYQKQTLDFQSSLRAAIAGGEPLEGVAFQPEAQPQEASSNGNGVSIDQEAALLGENGLTYQTLTEMLGAHNETLRAAMGL